MEIIVEKDVGWNNGISSVKYMGQFIFSAREARKLGFIAETREYEIHTLEYFKDENLSEAIKMMPDYKCWDSKRKVLIK
jgi:hypothetical protein